MLESGVMLIKSSLVPRKALGGSSQTGGRKVHISTKVWFRVEGKGGLWVVVRPSGCPSLRVVVPQAFPERGASRACRTLHKLQQRQLTSAATGACSLLAVKP
ncbi:UNVERIFIED_CONTAM: hypothetical protein K2H54_024653 [Gekko kuhli]